MSKENLDKDTMEVLKEVKVENETKKEALKTLKSINEFQREIGQPDTESERLALDADSQIKRIDKSLKKRGI